MFYEVTSIEGYEWITPINEADFDYFFNIENDRKENRKNMRMKITGEGNIQYSDFPWLDNASLIMRESVYKNISNFLIDSGKFFNLKLDTGENIFLFSPYRIDALDEKQSDVLRFADGRIMYVKKTKLKTDIEIKSDIFRLNYQGSSIFVSDNFIELYKQNNYKGLEFIKI